MEEMNIFGSVEHNDDNSDKWPDLCENPTNQDMLDYMALVTARFLNCQKAFKGGYMLNQLIADNSRMTHDIDFSIMKQEHYEDVKAVLKKLGEYFISKGLASSFRVKEDITETSSGGIDIYRDGIRGSEKILGIDIGLHSLSYGVTEYNISIGQVQGFEIERMLADKLTAILSRKRFRRTKDLYDFYAITNLFDVDCAKVYRYTEIRGNAEWNNIPFNDIVLSEYEKAWGKLQLVSPNNLAIIKPSFEDAIQRFYAISIPLKDNIYDIRWDHVERKISRK